MFDWKRFLLLGMAVFAFEAKALEPIDGPVYVISGGEANITSDFVTSRQDEKRIIQASNGAKVNIAESVVFADNYDNTYDIRGMIYAEGGSVFEIGNNVLFKNNSYYNAGAIYADNSTFNFGDGVSFESNNISQGGNAGAVWGDNNSIFNFGNNTKFVGNEAVVETGGAIRVDASTFVFKDGTLFENNKAYFGGAIGAEAGKMTFGNNTKFVGNESDYWGGAISAYSGSEFVFGNETSFLYNNGLNLSGGAIQS